MTHVLIVEDDRRSQQALAELVEDAGFEVSCASSLVEARKLLAARPIELILADLMLPDGQGIDLLEEEGFDFDLVVITGEASLESAVEALRKGAMEYLTKPIDLGRIEAILSHFQRTRELKSQVSNLREELREAGRFGPMVGTSAPMKRVYDLIEKVAGTEATAFVIGESGTGKELVAQTIHRMSQRSGQPLLPLNCGAVSPTLIESELFGHEKGAFTGAERRHHGHFERADEGTLFLDEITEMPIELQVKLLRVLESGRLLRVGGTDPVEVDVRLIAASNRDPREAVEEGVLREDLYYRLRVFPIHLPPLRDRGAEEIEQLARHFVSELDRDSESKTRISDEALDLLVRHPWPGNVRELKNVIQRAHILSDERIEPDSLPPEVRQEEVEAAVGPYLKVRIGSKLADVEKRLILATLDQFDDRRKDTSEALGISPKTLYNRLKAYEND